MKLQASIIQERKQRMPNFSEFEKSELVALVSQEADVIESRHNDSRSVAKKDRAWVRISQLYNNTLCGIDSRNRRDTRQLKLLWKNLKSKTRRLIATHPADFTSDMFMSSDRGVPDHDVSIRGAGGNMDAVVRHVAMILASCPRGSLLPEGSELGDMTGNTMTGHITATGDAMTGDTMACDNLADDNMTGGAMAGDSIMAGDAMTGDTCDSPSVHDEEDDLSDLADSDNTTPVSRYRY